MSVDTRLFALIHRDLSHPWLDGLFQAVTVLGHGAVVAVLALLWLWVRARRGSGRLRREVVPVVVAMGPWSDLFRRPLALPPVGGLKGYSVILRPRSPVPPQALFAEYESADGTRPSPEIVPRPDGTVWLCGMSSSDPLPADPAAVSVDETSCTALRRIAATLCGPLAGAELLASQACYRPICADAMPLLGRAPGAEGAYVATGHNCWGMLNAPATGLVMSELLLDGAATSVNLAGLDPMRPM